MKAARFFGKHDIRVQDVLPPGNLGYGQVLVEPIVCGICGTDLHEYEAGPIFTPRTPNPYSGTTLPQILGHEFSGRVVAVGEGVERLRPGSGSRSSRRSDRGTTIFDAGTSLSRPDGVGCRLERAVGRHWPGSAGQRRDPDAG